MHEIYACLEQKKTLITEIMNLTQKIELRTREPEIELDSLLDLRGAYISRVDKCDHLMLNLSKSLPEEQQKRLQQIFSAELPEKDCTDEERPLLQLVKECNSILQEAAVVDKAARDAILAQCNDLREKINQSRKTENQKAMYNNIR